ncbi:methyltransferase domain-containing protein [Niallia oryzisoli]|uniref:Methyltransferase domain-containing protein n=1 Tax=Niallia oryzisoli TaxID=1737571 RepID=A0ABZ2CCF3_9BACI
MNNHRITDQWDANLYDNKHAFVSKLGSDLIDLLAPQKGEDILDLGCGTGDLAMKLFDFGANVTGVDQSENMIHTAKNKYPFIQFIVQDAVNLNYHHEFDAVFSNATLHWVKPPKQALQGIFNGLKHGGRFVAEFGAKGNVKTITDEIIKAIKRFGFEYKMEHFPWYYPSSGEYTSLMEEVGFEVVFAQLFERPTSLEGEYGLKNWIEMFGNSLFEGIPETSKREIITNVEQRLMPDLYNQEAQCWVADYKRIRVIGMKK